VEASAKYEIVLNMKTPSARLEHTAQVLARADEVIE